MQGGVMAKKNRLYSAEEGAFMTRLTMSSFRTKLSRLGIKGKKDGTKAYYTKTQLQDLYDGKASKMIKALASKKARAKKSTVRRVARKERGKG